MIINREELEQEAAVSVESEFGHDVAAGIKTETASLYPVLISSLVLPFLITTGNTNLRKNFAFDTVIYTSQVNG